MKTPCLKQKTKPPVHKVLTTHTIGNGIENKTTISAPCVRYGTNNKREAGNMVFTIILDTETNGKITNYRGAITDTTGVPRMVQLAYAIYQDEVLVEEVCVLVQPKDFIIPIQATQVHGITTEHALEYGQPLSVVLDKLHSALALCDEVVCHNTDFDLRVVHAEFVRANSTSPPDFSSMKISCTMKETTSFVGIKNYYGFKWASLEELHNKLFGVGVEGAHDALHDVRATARCYFALKKRGVMK